VFGIDLIGSIDGADDDVGFRDGGEEVDGADDDVGFREGVVEGVLDGGEEEVGMDEGREDDVGKNEMDGIVDECTDGD